MRSGKLFHFLGSLLPSYKREKIIFSLTVHGGVIPWLSSGQDLDFQCHGPRFNPGRGAKISQQGSVLSTAPKKGKENFCEEERE